MAPPHRAGAKLEGRIFNEQQTTFVCIVPHLPQRWILGAIGGGFEACRSMPCHSGPNFSRVEFFFDNILNLWTFVAQACQNWMVV